MTPEARNAKWHFSRILLASFFIQGRRHDTWSRTGRSQKGTLSFKLPVHLSARGASQNSRRASEKNFQIRSSQRTKSLMSYEIQCHTKAGGVFTKAVLGPSLLTFSYRTSTDSKAVSMKCTSYRQLTSGRHFSKSSINIAPKGTAKVCSSRIQQEMYLLGLSGPKGLITGRIRPLTSNILQTIEHW